MRFYAALEDKQVSPLDIVPCITQDLIYALKMEYQLGTPTLHRQKIDGKIKSVSFDGYVIYIAIKQNLETDLQRLYICIITYDHRCRILNSDLEVLCSFDLDIKKNEDTFVVHVFTRSRGLVFTKVKSIDDPVIAAACVAAQGSRKFHSYDEQGIRNCYSYEQESRNFESYGLAIVKFKEWTVELSLEAEMPFNDDPISTMSTREDLIFAGTFNGDVGGWDYGGRKLYHIVHQPSPSNFVISISIGLKRILVAAEDVIEYTYPPPESSDSQALQLFRRVGVEHIEKERKGNRNEDELEGIREVNENEEKMEGNAGKLPGLLWATYGSSDKYVIKLSYQYTSAVSYYRPLVPLASSKVVYVLGVARDQNHIEVRNIYNDEVLLDKFEIPDGNEIKHLWGDKGRLFMTLHEESDVILMRKYADDIPNDQQAATKLAESFSLCFVDSL